MALQISSHALGSISGRFTEIFRLFHGNTGPFSRKNAYRRQGKWTTNAGTARSVMAESVGASTWFSDSQCVALMPPYNGFNGAQYDDILSSGGLAKTCNRTAYIMRLVSKCRAGAVMSPIEVPKIDP